VIATAPADNPRNANSSRITIMGTRYPTDSEVKLGDIAFQIAMLAAENFHGKPLDELAAWVGRQLALCGFENQPIGSVWTCVTRVHDQTIDTDVPSMEEKMGERLSSSKTRRIEVVSANRAD
jgi:arginyl-tRNA synthetase